MLANLSSQKTQQRSFQFKARHFNCTVLQLLHYNLQTIVDQLNKTREHMPNFFQGNPVIIDLEKMPLNQPIDFIALKELLLANQMVAIGIQAGSAAQQESANKAHLSTISPSKAIEPAEKEQPEQEILAKVITQPIRSGMQIYAKGTDLIVTTQVSAGAEIMADGHIHAYGTLRGRVLAGVQGNTSARIFCKGLDAELISIAGYYLTQEEMQALQKPEGMIQIYLQADQLMIEPI